MSREQTSTLLSKVREICNHCPGTRNLQDLKYLHDFVSSKTEIIHDPFWKFLEENQRIRLCAYFRYVKHEEDNLIFLDGPEADLKLLVRGSAELACGDHIIPMTAGRQGPSLGAIQVPSSVQRLIQHTAPSYDTFHEEGKTCYEFIKKIRANYKDQKLSRPSILFFKGSHSMYLNRLDLRPFMEKFFDKLVSGHVLNHLRLKLPRRKWSFYSFPPGHPIIVEGTMNNKIVLTLRGRCELRKSLETIKYESGNIIAEMTNGDLNNIQMEDDNVHIGYVSPITFVGFLPRFTNELKSNENVPQPLTLVAETSVRCLVLDADSFFSSLEKIPMIFRLFREIAESQMKWLTQYLPRKVAKMLSDQQEDIKPFPESSMKELERLIEMALTKKPKLNKHRVLTKFKTFFCEEEEKDLDQFRNMNFSALSMKTLMKDIEADWGGEDPDFLKPCPTVVNRKFHGKTLPIISSRTSFKDPLL